MTVIILYSYVCIKVLESNRTDKYFKSFFDVVQREASSKYDPPVLPRQRRLPKRIDDGAPQHVFTAVTVEDLYRKEYIEAIDCVKGELERRFHQDNFLFVRSIEAMLINSADGKPFNLTQKFKDIYDKHIDMERLYLQL